eukprot:6191941-Pleurochrysis_carterae.AAC.2
MPRPTPSSDPHQTYAFVLLFAGGNQWCNTRSLAECNDWYATVRASAGPAAALKLLRKLQGGARLPF